MGRLPEQTILAGTQGFLGRNMMSDILGDADLAGGASMLVDEGMAYQRNPTLFASIRPDDPERVGEGQVVTWLGPVSSPCNPLPIVRMDTLEDELLSDRGVRRKTEQLAGVGGPLPLGCERV